LQILGYFKGKSIGVAGLGYVGRHLADFLNTYSAEFQYSLSTFTRSNIEDVKGKEFDYFFNCAGNTGDFRQKMWETIESNLFLTKYLLENIKIKEAYIALSSTRLYGFSDKKDILFEENEIDSNPKSHLSIDFVYDGTKKLLESILWNLGGKVRHKIIICRLSNLYGKYTKSDLNDSTFFKLMLRSKIEDRPLKVEQNVLSTKGYIFVEDAILGIIHSAVYAAKNNVYNICSGESYSIGDWMRYFKIDYTLGNEINSPSYSRNSIKKAAAELFFHPKTFLTNVSWSELFEAN